MSVCIIRNTQVETNASMIRVIDSLIDSGVEPITLTRNRKATSRNFVVEEKLYEYKDEKVKNFEIQLNAKQGIGILNVFQLLFYQILVFTWLIKNVNSYDKIHAFNLEAGMPALVVAKFHNKKIVYHIADYYIDSRNGIPGFLKKMVERTEHFIIGRSDATIICTEKRKIQIKGSSPKRLYVVHNTPAFDNDDSEKSIDFNYENTSDNNITLGYVGALSESRFIRQVVSAVGNNKNLNLLIGGIGPLDDFVSEEARRNDNISYYGKLKYEEAFKLYEKCDLMFAIYDPKIRNHKYSAPNKVYESMMLGKPIVVAKNTGIDDIVVNEGTGFAIEYSEDDFELLMNELLNQSSMIEIAGKRANAIYPKYSWEKMKKIIQKLYEDIENE